MKTVGEIRKDFCDVKEHLERGAKLQALRRIRGGLQEVEMAAAKDFSFPLSEVQAARALLPDVEAALNIAESNARRFRWEVPA